MYTVKQLEKIYIRRIPKDRRNKIASYIDQEYPQQLINEAINEVIYKRSNEEMSNLCTGELSKKYPYLYWLVEIYIHPLTALQALAKKMERDSINFLTY